MFLLGREILYHGATPPAVINIYLFEIFLLFLLQVAKRVDYHIWISGSCPIPAQNVARELAQEEYDHVAFFQNSLGSASTPTKPKVSCGQGYGLGRGSRLLSRAHGKVRV